MTVRRLRHAAWIWIGVGLGCGGAAPVRDVAPLPERASVETEPAEEPDMATSAEIGALEEAAAEASFQASGEGLRECVRQGVERIAWLAGSIELAVKVDARRRVERVWAAASTLGERGTEKCMFEALRQVTWPKPVGGAYGIARNTLEFGPRKGTEPPAVWDAGVVQEVLEEHAAALAECRGGDSNDLLVTLYIGEGGKALSGGASSSEAVDEAAVDCVVETLLAARFPEPERVPTKVRFSL